MVSLKQKVVKGLIWQIIETVGLKGIGFAVSIVLARLLAPSDFGLLALLTVIVTLTTTFVDAGFGQALIQKNNLEMIDVNTAFLFNILIASVCYLGLFFFAPYVADYYNQSMLSPLLRWLSVGVIFAGMNGVQNAILKRDLRFKDSAKCSLIQTVVYGFSAASFAWCGYGVWSLVWGQLISGVLGVVLRFIFVRWVPSWSFSLPTFMILFSVGGPLFGRRLLTELFNNMTVILVGRFFTMEVLGLYERGRSLAYLVGCMILAILSDISFSALSRVQDDREIFTRLLRRAFSLSAFLIVPAMIGFALIAPTFIRLVYGAKWMSCVPYLQLVCLDVVLWPFVTLVVSGMNACGRTKTVLYLEIINKGIGFVLLLIVIPFGLMTLLVSNIVYGLFLALGVYGVVAQKELDYRFSAQLKVFAKPLIATCLMGGGIIGIPVVFSVRPMFQLSVQILLGGFIYFIIMRFFQDENLNYCLNLVKDIYKGVRK